MRAPVLGKPSTLALYVAEIHGRSDALGFVVRTVETCRWQDQGFEVSREVADYHFNDGAVIRRTVEQDDIPTDAACAECWIIYEVLSDGESGAEIHPQRQMFQNACREAFWLAYHTYSD